MDMKDFLQLNCPECNALLYIEKKMNDWYCGHCGKKFVVKDVVNSASDKKITVIKKAETTKGQQKNNVDQLKMFAQKGNKPNKSKSAPQIKKDATISSEVKKEEPKVAETPKPVEVKKEEPKAAETPKPVEVKKEEPKAVEAPKPVEVKKEEPKAVETPNPVENTESEEEKKEEIKSSYVPPEFQIYLNKLLKYNGESAVVVIPNGVTAIDNEAFKGNKNIQKVSIPNSVIVIGSNVFENCSELEEVSLPAGLKKINYMTFNGCDKLHSITIPAGVDEIMFNSLWCSGLNEITFKNSDTRWETDSNSTNPSFMVDMNDTGKGVTKIIYEYDGKKRELPAKDVFKHKSIRKYFISNELCQHCGGQIGGLFGKKCKDCGEKKDY